MQHLISICAEFDKVPSRLENKNVKKLPISLVVITLNEEKNIERCLRSAPFVSEILVVDSFSADKTVQIASDLGARVLQEKWRGFGAQKRWAVDEARHDWVLCLDADEVISTELADELQKSFEILDPHAGYEFSRKSFFLGRWILHGGWYPDKQLRLFHRNYSQWSEDPVHEKVKSKKVIFWNLPILHFVFDDISHQVKTNDRYSSLQAMHRFQRGVKFSLPKLIIKPWGKFIECYFVKKGFMDGLPGFIIAVSAAYSYFLRIAKIWELERKEKNS